MSARGEKISKQLSYVLRHNPQSIGLQLDEHGYATVAQLLEALNANGFSLTIDELREVVETSDKKRFAFDDAGLLIRANQGHSIKVDLNYEAREAPSILYHGTASRFIESIKEQGLLKGQRHHVHLTESKETAISVGGRYGKPVLLEIEAGQMQKDGISFFLSDNNVWLTDHVAVAYIRFPE